jgi:hypothetical protein
LVGDDPLGFLLDASGTLTSDALGLAILTEVWTMRARGVTLQSLRGYRTPTGGRSRPAALHRMSKRSRGSAAVAA